MKKKSNLFTIAARLLIVIAGLLAYGCSKEKLTDTRVFSVGTGYCPETGGDVLVVVHDGDESTIDSVPPAPDVAHYPNNGELFNVQMNNEALNYTNNLGRVQIHAGNGSGKTLDLIDPEMSESDSTVQVKRVEVSNGQTHIKVCDNTCTPIGIEFSDPDELTSVYISLVPEKVTIIPVVPTVELEIGKTYKVTVYYGPSSDRSNPCTPKIRYLTLLP